MLVIGRRGDSSPIDSGVDTSEWEENHRGPRMSLDPYNYGTDSAWASRNGSEPKKNGPDNGRPPSMTNGGTPGRSPKNSPILGQGKDQRKMPVQAASQFPARTNFLLEHLSSFTLTTPQEAQVPARERLKQTKELLAKGNQWTKEMEMRLTDTDVVLLDGETQDVVEVFSLNIIGHVHHLSDDPDLNSVLVFNTIQTKEKFGAMHLFQSDRVPAAVVATEIMKASSSKSAMPNRFASRGGAILPPPPTHPAPPPPTEVDQERLDLYEKSLVAQTIAAFSAVPDDGTKKTAKPQVSSKYLASESSSDIPDETLSAELLEARTNRDVQILNHCIDDIESLVLRTKRSAEAWKKLQKKKGKVKQNQLTQEARPPPEADFYDAFQKLKHALNLLGKLRHHIHNPNAAELVHYLFVPLSLLVRCTGGPEKARAVVAPLLTTHAIDLLQNCLSSKETDFWMALGPNWTYPKSSKQFKDQFISPYTPVFKDGWVPPEVIAGKDVSNLSAAIAANAANAAAVAQLTDGQRKGEDSAVNLQANPAVLSAAAKFRRLASVKKPDETTPTSPTKKGLRKVRVLFDFQARNSKELTVQKGEEVAVLLDNRQWWCVRNSEGSIGFVPSTIVEEAVVLPSPPTTAPPPVPVTQVHKIETTSQTPPSSPSQAARVSESPKIPHVELRHVSISKTNRPVSAPPIQLVIPPPPASRPPPSTPPPPATPPPPVVLKTNGTTLLEATVSGGNDFAKAIQAKNLKKVDPEEEKKRREQSQQNRMSSTDMLNDELKRRMTSSQGGLTPRVQRKDLPTVDLTADSSASEVKRWLESKGFTESCVTALSGKSAKHLESMTKDQLKQACGDSEGSRVFSQFAVQKANWEAINKGSELAFIMQKRKERSEVKATEELGNAGELRSIVADAKAAAAQEELEFRRRTSSTGKKIITIGAPATKPRPKSFAGPETMPRKDSKAERKSSREDSFNTEFIPPPPLLDSEEQPTSGEASPTARKISSEDVESIVREQKKQQELLLEHDKQLFLLEQLQRQKLELEQQKREFEEQQQRVKQAELQEQQKELHRQIQAQQDQLKLNEDKLVQQQRFLSTYENVSPQFTYAQLPPVVPQMPVMPIAGVPTGPPAYLPMGGLQPMYTPYPSARAQPGVTHVVPSVNMPSVSVTPPPGAVLADNTTRM